MGVTLKQVAHAAGVSEMTVSNVLSGRHKPVRAKAVARAQHVRQVADRLGYRVSQAARATRSGRTGNIALLLSSRSGRSTLPEARLQGIHDAAADAGLNVLISYLPEDDGELPRVVREHGCDGLLINYTDHDPPSLLAEIDRHGIPAIWLNADKEHDAVRFADEEASFEATARLIELGHRDIAFLMLTHGLDETNAHYSARERLAGYRRAMTKADLPAIVLAEPGEEPVAGEARLEATDRYLGKHRPSAVLAFSAVEATACQAVLHAQQRRVPNDVSLATFTSDPFGRNAFSAGTTAMILPEEELGRRGIAMVHRRIEHPSPVEPSTRLPLTWRPAKIPTTGPAAG
jgi:DNA-binding LacI/PurR family transcriptional regulator